MNASRTTWQGALARVTSLAVLTVALCIALALPAHAVNAAPASCGSAQSGCGPLACHDITAADLSQPGIARVGNASAQLSRDRGFDSSIVSVSGTGWPAGATVEVSLATYSGASMWVDPRPFTQGVANASGGLTIAAFSPPQVFGCMTPNLSQYAPDPVLLILQAGEQARVPLIYTIYPNPSFQTAAPLTINPGAPVILTGAGWDPSQTVTITPAIEAWPANGYPLSYISTGPGSYTPLPAQATTITTQPDGTFSVMAHTPIEEPETQISYLAGAVSPLLGAFTVPLSGALSVLPTASSSLSLSGSGALAGAKARLTGANWPPNQTLQINYCRDQGLTYCEPAMSQTLAWVHADNAGRLDTNVVIPVDARPGPIIIQVSPTASPFAFDTYTRAQPFAILFPFDQAHPRLALAIHAAPYAAGALIIALLLLAAWLLYRRRAARKHAASPESGM